MDVINQILSTYAMFFDWEMWGEVLTSPVSWGLIGTLIIMEGLLSADNALVLAVLVKHLPEKQRKKALMYGLLGAYFFRFVFIGIGVYLVKFDLIKVLGAAYLMWLVIKYFREKGGEEEEQGFNKNSWLVRTFGMFWATVATVEVMDIAFSVDSILAAFAVSDQVWVLFLGGIIGILLMRTVARIFLSLIDRVPELETTAYILIAIISIKMLIGINLIGIHVPHILFFGIIIAAFLFTFFIHYFNKSKVAKKESNAAKDKVAAGRNQ